jgi:hypothetical protein
MNESHRELSGKSASHFQFGRDDVPSHEALLIYHKDCSNRKDKLFSDISATLAPTQEMEEINFIAGLWPRITPRSVLHQLAQDHISTLPDHRELVIMQYAVSFIRYQQSLRLLDLSARQSYEELLREIEAIPLDVPAKSIPDWLLIQVRRMFCWSMEIQ